MSGLFQLSSIDAYCDRSHTHAHTQRSIQTLLNISLVFQNRGSYKFICTQSYETKLISNYAV